MILSPHSPIAERVPEVSEESHGEYDLHRLHRLRAFDMGEWDGVGICGAGHLSKGAWRTCERAVVSVEVKLRYML